MIKLHWISMLWIVSGPSSIGKSTFIDSQVCRNVTNLTTKTPILFAYEFVSDNLRTETDHFMHYNILRPVQRRYSRNRKTQTERILPRNLWSVIRRHRRAARGTKLVHQVSFDDDPAWQNIVASPARKRAIVLVANYDELMRRVERRIVKENRVAKGGVMKEYDSQFWLDIYRQIDLVSIYWRWCKELESYGIEYLILNSTTPDYSTIEDKNAIAEIVIGGASR